MKIEARKDGLLIVPETEFEARYLRSNFNEEGTRKVWLKHGPSLDELVGLVIENRTVPTERSANDD